MVNQAVVNRLSDASGFVPFDLRLGLEARYGESHRCYHTLAHVKALFRHLRQHIHLAQEPRLIAAAIWYHDAIYETRRHDNEEQSAELARVELGNAGWDLRSVQCVSRMILATKHHAAEAADTDTALFLDLDLSILGANHDAYCSYGAAIRAEFSWVSDEAYMQGRSSLLLSFLNRNAIYRTPQLRAAWEASARLNMARELEALSEQAHSPRIKPVQ
jgi:predicted metal-dependent HD superfamily phosphohydrolase